MFNEIKQYKQTFEGIQKGSKQPSEWNKVNAGHEWGNQQRQKYWKKSNRNFVNKNFIESNKSSMESLSK